MSAECALPVSPPKPFAERFASLDTLRGLTILVMIFVNDIAGVPGVPPWMEHHEPPDGDGMTFVDLVFPAFLFIVGMSIPFALGRRLDRGESRWLLARHVLTRTLSLLAIGVLMVNTESEGNGGLLHRYVWNLLMYLGVVLAWNELPAGPSARRRLVGVLKAIGVALLVFLVFIFDHKKVEGGLIELRPSWWGILGLIGWAYLIGCITYALLRRNVAGILGVMGLLYCFNLCDKVGFFDDFHLGAFTPRDWLDLGAGIGGQGGITVAGLALGVVLAPGSSITEPYRRIRWAVLCGAAMWVAGYFLHQLAGLGPMFFVNKNNATVPWCLYCSAITMWIWAALYWLMDVRGWKAWAGVLQPAGENPLFAYLLHPILIYVFCVMALATGTDNLQWKLGANFPAGFARALMTAFGLVWLTGFLKDRGVRPRL